MKSKAQCSRVLAGGRSLAGTVSRPVTSVSVLKPTSHESRPGIPIPPLTPSSVQRPPMYSVTCVWVVLHALHRRELDRLVLGDLARRRVADRELDRRQDAADRERDQQAEAVMAVAAAPQHPDRVDRGDQEAGDQVGGQDHVRDLVGDRGVEDHLERVDVGDGAVGAEREALGLVHPGVDGDHREGAPDPADRDRHAGPEVLPARRAASSRRCRSSGRSPRGRRRSPRS